MAAAQAAGEWDELGVELGEAGAGLRKAGSEALLIASNTMHCLVQSIETRSGLPVLHIADATGRALQDKGCRAPLLLGTRFTMEQDFYRRRLQTQFGLEVVCPDEAGRARVHQVIYDELCQGVILDESRDALRQIIAQTLPQGVDSVILGCTELGMILSSCDELPPIFDTTALHVGMALDWMTLA
ncbi:aspartate/glutamate racemase family protein [Asaia astilbis]|uniref:aspartate/glutamate racemase family protein n=1 Tax=Asaia astilbis TaxID=610244 RepID=UPI0018DE8881|nr:amino acid racemase [Asaia astilbis]